MYPLQSTPAPNMSTANGPVYAPPPVIPTPVTVLSSTSGQTALNQNTASLANLEKAITGQASTPTSPYTFQLLPTGKVDIMENGKSISQGGPGFDASYAQQLGYNPGPVMGGASPATQKMAQDINNAVSTGGLTAAEKAGLDGLTTTQDGLLASAAAARSALESKDYPSMDFHTRRAEELQRTFADQLSKYYESVKPLRERAAAALTPGEAEHQLQKKLINIRGQVDAFKEQTEMDKLREYEGQTLGFAGGRAAEIDMKAQSRLRTMAAEEKNVLLELGLEQEARKMESQSVEQQLNYLHDDFDLQSKIQDKFQQIEDNLFDRADQLEEKAKSTLTSILDKMEGVDPDKLPPDAAKNLEEIAARANIPYDLVVEALKTQYQKRVFDEAMKRAQEARLSDSAEDSDGVSFTPEDRRTLTGAGFAPSDLEHIENGVRENGFQSVYDAEKAAGASDAQLAALAKVYGVAQKVSRDQIAASVTLKVAQDGLRDNYTDAELKDLADEYGFSSMWTGAESDVSRFLESDKAKEVYIDLLYKQYEAQGMTE